MKKVVAATNTINNMISDIMKLDEQITDILGKLGDLPDPEWDKFTEQGGLIVYDKLGGAHNQIQKFWRDNYR